MTTFEIKLFAIIFMVTDHIGFFFFPQLTILRVIGRLAFPMFAWLIANGAIHTKNSKIYLLRLAIFALISQVPFTVAIRQVDPNFWALNVFFTLTLGLLAIEQIKNSNNKLTPLGALIIFPAIGQLTNAEFGAMGVASVIAFYIFFQKKMHLLVSQALIYLLIPALTIVAAKYLNIELAKSLQLIWLAPFALLSLPLLLSYNNQRGPKLQYLFYIFYPLQYSVFFLLYSLKN